MKRLLAILMLALFPVLVVVLPGVAFAQTDLAGTSIWDTILVILGPALGIVGGSSLVSAFVSSKGGPVRTFIMSIVDLLAANWLKARNSDDAQ
jgi:hypothetical protein